MGLPPILALFFFSGASSLIYEVVWLRIFFRVFGSTASATSTILAVFMAGLAAGAWAAGRRSKNIGSPLRAYGIVELALALLAAAATAAALRLPEFVSGLPIAAPAGLFLMTGVRSGLAFAVLILPTALMGASLPLLAEHCSAQAKEKSDRPALLYGVNTLGAVSGVVFSGFYSLGRWGETRTIAIAAAANVLVGLGAVFLASREPSGAAAAEPAVPYVKKKKKHMGDAPSPLAGDRILWLMAFSGFGALALEVLWTRMLVLLLGTSIYAFTSMLAATLVGIGAGSLLCARWLDPKKDLGRAFAGLQVLAGVLGAASLELYLRQGLARLDQSYLYSPIHSAGDFASLLAISGLILLPVTLTYGALFPLAAAIADARGAGDRVGRLYTFNTLGGVLGSLACGFALIPALGTKNAFYAICCLHVGLGALASLWAARGSGGRAAAGLALVVALAALRPDPFFEIVRARLERRAPGKVLFHDEGASSTVTAYETSAGETLLLINGIIVSGKGSQGRFMAHFPLILQAAPKKALVICLGAGNTFRAAVDHHVSVDLVELMPEVIAGFSKLWPDHDAYLHRSNARVINDDGRSFLLTSRSKYDLIVFDGTPPIYSAGTVNLYSKEFIELAKSRLTPAGMLALWVPLPCFDDDFGMLARNFTDAFPHTLAWAQPHSNIWGVLLIGSRIEPDLDPALVDRRALERGLAQADPWLNRSLLAPGKLMPDAVLREIAARYPSLTDDRPWIEFPLPLFLRHAPLRQRPEALFRN